MESYTTRPDEPVLVDPIKDTKRMYPKIGKEESQPIENDNTTVKEKENEKSVSIVVEEDEKTSSEESRLEQEDSKKEQDNMPTPGPDNNDIISSYQHEVGSNRKFSYNESKCCQSVKQALQQCPPLYWYLAPITFDLGYSLSCFFYHWFSFAFTLAVWIFTVTALGTFVPLMVLACVGLPLLYLLFEIILLLTRLSFYLNYWMVENDKELFKKENKWKLRLTLDNKNLPPWSTCCSEGMRLDRVKFLFTSLAMYVYIIYHLIISPIMVLVCGIFSIPILYSINFMIYVVWYPMDTHRFKNRNQCYYTKSGWCITTVEDVVLCFFIGLLTLPVFFKLCSFMAQQAKKVNYWVLTDYYKNISSNNQVGKGLLNRDNNNISNYGNQQNNNNNNSNSTVLVVSSSIGVGSINNETNNDTSNLPVTSNLKELNDGGNTTELQPTEKNIYDIL